MYMRYTQGLNEEYPLSRSMSKPGTYYQVWFMYMRYTQGQNEEYSLSRSMSKPGTYYQVWFMYMRYTEGQNEEYSLSRSVYYTRYLLSKVPCSTTAPNMAQTCRGTSYNKLP